MDGWLDGRKGGIGGTRTKEEKKEELQDAPYTHHFVVGAQALVVLDARYAQCASDPMCQEVWQAV
jgi:hypothetical protein